MIKMELFNYDIFPKVFPCGKPVEVTIKPMGVHAAFEGEYTIQVRALNEGNVRSYPERNNLIPYNVTPDVDGCLRITHTFMDEQEHYLDVMKGEDRVVRLAVYSVLPDMVGRYPFRGDLHMHTFRSDGHQAPAIVAAEYRKNGYDFLAITDHRRYYPSLEAMEAFKDIQTEYNLVPGEEVHLKNNDVHIVNFGGKYSVNALVEGAHIKEVGDDKKLRSIDGNCPDVMSEETFEKTIWEFAETLNIPDGIEKYTYAACVWTFDRIREADGLGIFAHPYWIQNVYHVPETLTEYLMETQPFDAFEVLGGENYFEQNGLQTVRFYEDRAKGREYPIVGSTDSHSCVHNRNGYICSTIVFAPENTRESLIASIKDLYTVAVDSISTELRFVGDMRFVRYGCFLMREFFPLHDELTYEEGRLLREYACGNKSAADDLKRIYGRMKSQREKYFSF